MGTRRRAETESTIVRLIAIEMNRPEEEVRRARSLRRDLRVDSVAAANLLFAIEEEFGIEVSLDGVEVFDAIDAIVDIVERSQIDLLDERHR